MDDLIWRSLQGNTNDEDERILAEWRVNLPTNEQRYQSMATLWNAASLVEHSRPATRRPSAAEILHLADVQALDGRRREAARIPLHRWLRAGVVAAAAALVLVVGGLHVLQSPPANVQEFVTAESETASVRLADGSVVRLGPASRLRLPQGRRTREVWLDGTAFFAVAKQQSERFTVVTRAGRATVLGTRFEMRIREEELRLVVVEGRVVVEAQGNSVEVGAGEASYVIEGASPAVTRVEDPKAMLEWMEGVLIFQDTPLPQVAEEIEDQYGMRLVIADSLLASRVVTAFFVDQPIEAVVAVICKVTGARCSLGDSTTTMDLLERTSAESRSGVPDRSSHEDGLIPGGNHVDTKRRDPGASDNAWSTRSPDAGSSTRPTQRDEWEGAAA